LWLAARLIPGLGSPRFAARFIARFITRLDSPRLVTAWLVTPRLRPGLHDAGFYAPWLVTAWFRPGLHDAWLYTSWFVTARLNSRLINGRLHHWPV